MPAIRKSAALAVGMSVACIGSVSADSVDRPENIDMRPESAVTSQSEKPTAQGAPKANQARVKVSSGGVVQGGPAGTLQKQIPSVSTGCLRPQLVSIIRGASSHFGSAAIITSGYRPGHRSYHGKCMAADVQIAGVSAGTLARYFKAQPGVGGVGTYRHTRSVHVDIAERKFSWHGGGRRRVASLN